MKVPSKIFNDPIHGHIELSNISVKIIDTAQFQRLRDISQLGGVYYVFPGASSKRFEHCIGVAHLARTFVERLMEKQPELGITQTDMLCIEIAGLCHDLGHGPFSHLFDGKVLPAINGSHAFAHEHASVGILDILIEENNLVPEFAKYGLNTDDIHFIKELILGDISDAPPGFVWRGRGQKTFLYDIVANKRNGIDVDKFDYFARDCFVLGLTKSFDAMRLMKFARVFPVTRNATNLQGFNLSQDLFQAESTDSQSWEHESVANATTLEICYDIKEAWNIFELFHTRYALHKRAYQHRVSNAMEEMMAEALILADPYVFIPGKDGVPRRMSECPRDLHAYWRLTEYIMHQIQHSVLPELQPARTAVLRIRQRDLFTLAGEIILAPETRDRLKSVASGEGTDIGAKAKKQMIGIMQEQLLTGGSESSSAVVAAEDIFCTVVKIGYGKGNKNPVSDLTTFYMLAKETEDDVSGAAAATDLTQHSSSGSESSQQFECAMNEQLQRRKWKVGVVPQDSVSRLTPREFEETYIRVFARHKHQVSQLKGVFAKWCERNHMTSSLGSLTPHKRSRSSLQQDDDQEEF